MSLVVLGIYSKCSEYEVNMKGYLESKRKEPVQYKASKAQLLKDLVISYLGKLFSAKSMEL